MSTVRPVHERLVIDRTRAMDLPSSKRRHDFAHGGNLRDFQISAEVTALQADLIYLEANLIVLAR